MTQFQVRLRRRDIGNDEILDDLKRVSAEIAGSPLTRIIYDDRGEFGATTVIRKFGSWNNAIKLCGLEVASRQDITYEELFENLASVWTKVGRQPFGREMSDKTKGSIFSTATYEKRFGSWNKALIAFSLFVEGEQTVEVSRQKNKVFQKRTSRDINWRLRAKILIRDCCVCKMCGDSPLKNPDTVLHVDHIFPWSLGGESVEENLQTLCAKCNIGKSNELFETSRPHY
jgi:hypothetical protein